ncbi:hypothetical protein KA183_13380 [bacterium]|nr:hypothetical protein [bacterium]QQR57711.1 MAG: hypothetical protein IPG59_22520 [Candidatus Melainabacteria bacterium]
MPQKPPARLFVLLARESRQALIYRRGPSKQVQLISWNRQDDTFTPGQWFKGRIYERRCDISPDGKFLLSFLQDYGRAPYTWTVLSKPPYLTALTYWPKGDAWGGGALFGENKTIRLNHRMEEFAPGNDSSVIRHFQLEPLHEHSGRGEDQPIWGMRLARDGWTYTGEGHDEMYSYSKPSPKNAISLQMKIVNISSEPPFPWYHMHYRVSDTAGDILIDLDRTDWADWDQNGDLLFAKNGGIFRCCKRDLKAGKGMKTAVELINLNASEFENVAPPKGYEQW